MYRGGVALSEFRAAKLLRLIQADHQSFLGVAAEDVYFVQGCDGMSDADEVVLKELLGSVPATTPRPLLMQGPAAYGPYWTG